MEKVSVIIPTFNRFKYLLNTLNSVKNQTHNNLEIIVINDKSTQKEYYSFFFRTIQPYNFYVFRRKLSAKHKRRIVRLEIA